MSAHLGVRGALLLRHGFRDLADRTQGMRPSCWVEEGEGEGRERRRRGRNRLSIHPECLTTHPIDPVIDWKTKPVSLFDRCAKCAEQDFDHLVHSLDGSRV